MADCIDEVLTGFKVALTRQTYVGQILLANESLVCVSDTTTCWQTVGENRDKVYFSPTVCQHVVVSLTHTKVKFCQHELANISLTGEGRLRNTWLKPIFTKVRSIKQFVSQDSVYMWPL